MSNYLVIGSGLIGRLTAWRLLAAGQSVALLSSDNREGRDSAGYVAASMVAPWTEAVSADQQVVHWGVRSHQLWLRWLSELPEPVFYPAEGTLVVAHPHDQADLHRFRQRADYVVGSACYQALDAAQLRAREPELADAFDGALYFPDEACLDNRHLYQQLERLLSQHCDWQQCAPIVHLDGATLQTLCQQHFQREASVFDAVIDCRGNGALADMEQLRSVRGEVIRVHAPEVQLRHCIRLMHPRTPLYLAPRPNGEYVLGATVIESADRSPVSVRSGMELLSALYTLHRGFAEARILELNAHCRPALLGHMPACIATPWGYQLNGFYRHGYLFGPAMVQQLIDQLLGQPSMPITEEIHHAVV